MIILLSPSKTINPKPYSGSLTTPLFLEESQTLVEAVNKLGPKLGKTFGVSEKIAETNKEQFRLWSPEGETPAAWTYRGETFAGLSIERLSADNQDFAQDHLLIVSGLYGLLRPQDAIRPYRLEMSTRLEGPWGKNLYEFWGSKLADHVLQQDAEFILNCASDEYAKAIKRHLPKEMPVVTPKFLHQGKAKMSFAKYTRGLMARWAIENHVAELERIREFNAEGYMHDSSSSQLQPIFNAPDDFSLKGRWTKT